MTLKEYYESIIKDIKESKEVNTEINAAGETVITQDQYKQNAIKKYNSQNKLTLLGIKLFDKLSLQQKKEFIESYRVGKDDSIANNINKIMTTELNNLCISMLPNKKREFERHFGEVFEDYYDRIKDMFTPELKAKFEELKDKLPDVAFPNQFLLYSDQLIDKLDSFVSEDDKQLIIQDVDKEISVMDKPFEKEGNKDVIKALENASDEEKAILNELNDKVLYTFSPASISYHDELAEYEGKFIGLSSTKDLIAYSKQEEVLNGKVFVDKGSIIVRASEPELSKEYNDALNKVKYQLTDKRKQDIVNIMKFFTETTDLDGKKLFEKGQIAGDQGSKIYSYKPYMNNRAKARELVKKLNAGNLSPDERSQVMQDLNHCIEYTKDLDNKFNEIYSYIKASGIKKFPDNVTVARNGEMPEFAIRNYDIDSVLNGFFYTYGVLENANMTPEHFVENLDESMKELNNDRSDFAAITNYFKDYDPLQAIAAFENGSGLTLAIANYASTAVFIRPLNPVICLEDDPNISKENMTKYEFENRVLADRIDTEVDKFKKTYSSATNEEKIETMKNIICTNGIENVPTVSLINGVKDLYCPLTGHKVRSFNREEYLNKEDLDVVKIANNISTLRKQVKEVTGTKTVSPANARIMEAAKGLKSELLNRDLINKPNIKEIYDTKLFKASELVNKAKGDLDYEDYAKERFNGQFDKKLNSDNFVNSMLMVKAMSEKVRGMGFFHRHFSSEGIKNKKIYNGMKNKIYESGYDKNTLYDFLAGKNNMDTSYNKFVEKNGVEIQMNVRNNIDKEKINVADNNLRKSEVVINNPELNKDITKSK